MPLFLVPFLAWLGTAILTAITFFVSRKGILFGFLVLFIGLIGAAINLFVSEIDALIASVLPQSLSLAAPFIPDNMGLCLAAIVSAHIVCTGYRLTIKLIRLKASFMMS